MEQMGSPSTSEQIEMGQIEVNKTIGTDAVDIWQNMQHHEKQLSHKRKFLMGLSSSISFEQSGKSHTRETSILPESFVRQNDFFYEDVKDFVEKGFRGCAGGNTYKKSERTEVGCNGGNIYKKGKKKKRGRNGGNEQGMIDADVDVSDFYDINSNLSRIILTLLDDLSVNGLYNLAKAMTPYLSSFDKSRSEMKRAIKSTLHELQSSGFSAEFQVKIQKEISQLMKNRKNFRQNYGKHVKLILKCFHNDVMKVLNGLEGMHGQTLIAMHRKLNGIRVHRPQLRRHNVSNKYVWAKKVRKLSFELIHQHGESDELLEPLLKAMYVAYLSSKLESHPQDYSVPEFWQVNPKIERLQSEIVKAIKLLDQRIRKEDMEELRLLLDPGFKAEAKILRSAIRNLLKDFLFECNDMDAVPDYLLAALTLINKREHTAYRFLSKDLVEDDVECILNVGAHVKQILWDCDLSDQLDIDSVYAPEELEESDDGDIFNDEEEDQMLHRKRLGECQIRCDNFSEEIGSTGEPHHNSISSPTSSYEKCVKSTDEFASASAKAGDDDECSDTNRRGMFMFMAAENGSSPCESPIEIPDTISRQDSIKDSSVEPITPDDNCLKRKPMSENQHVSVQQVCDNASLAAYQLIGHVLDDFGRIKALGLDSDEKSYLRGDSSRPEGIEVPSANSMDKDTSGSIIVEAVRRVIPSFPGSQLEMVKKLLSL